MAVTPSTMLPLGTPAPEFSLPDPDGRRWSLADFADARALVVVFISNHCPYVKHIKAELAAFAREVQQAHDVATVAIMANDYEAYPDDHPDEMRRDAERFGYPFPYLIDGDQSVAKAYRAACTPDFFLFDRDRTLVYRGQFDGARPGNDEPITGGDLRAAIEALATDRPVPAEQTPSIGCNIKWRPGNAPDYFG